MRIDLVKSLKDNINSDIDIIEINNNFYNTKSELTLINQDLIDNVSQVVDRFTCFNNSINKNINQLVDNFESFDQNIAKEFKENGFRKFSKAITNK